MLHIALDHPRVVSSRDIFDDTRQVRRGEEADRRPERRIEHAQLSTYPTHRRGMLPRCASSATTDIDVEFAAREYARDGNEANRVPRPGPCGHESPGLSPQGGVPSSHASRIERNVRGILERGGSLPLVFPRYELGFSYGPRDDDDVGRRSYASGEEDGSDDASGYVPRLRAGHRMPHVLVQWNGDDSGPGGAKTRRNSSDDACYFSLTEISSALRDANPMPSPLFPLLAVGPTFDASLPLIDGLVSSVAKTWNVPIVLVRVLPKKRHDDACSNVASVIDARCAPAELLRREQALSGDDMEHGNEDHRNEEAVNALILIRPDGHIANVAWIRHETENGEVESTRIRGAIERGLESALGTRVLFIGDER